MDTLLRMFRKVWMWKRLGRIVSYTCCGVLLSLLINPILIWEKKIHGIDIVQEGNKMPNPNLPIAGGYNVYVGARYVPLIMGQWSETVAYEPMSVVVYEGNSYTSRTFVPAGVPVTNETYWVATGNYNAQVEQYRQEVVNLGNTVNTLEEKIDNISSLKNSNVLFIGDSYLNRTGSWGDICAAQLQLNYDKIAVSGYAIASNPIQPEVEKFFVANPSKINYYDYVIIGMGANEQDENAVANPVTSLYKYLRSVQDKAKLMLGVPSISYADMFYMNRLALVSMNYKSTWESLGGLWLPEWSAVLLQPNTTDSTSHPTTLGSELLGYRCARMMQGLPNSLYNNFTLTKDSITSSNWTWGNISLNYILKDNVIYVNYNGYGSGDLTAEQGYVTLGTLPNNYPPLASTFSLCRVSYTTATITTPTEGIGTINFNNYTIKITGPWGETDNIKSLSFYGTMVSSMYPC